MYALTKIYIAGKAKLVGNRVYLVFPTQPVKT